MRLPSLKFLKTFQVAAKLQSFKAAAGELFVTPSAVSHQIKALEGLLGVVLFERGVRALALTDAGAHYLEHINDIFAKLESVTEQLQVRFGRSIIRLNVPPFFANELLLPRLASFSQAREETDIRIETTFSAPKTHPPEAIQTAVASRRLDRRGRPGRGRPGRHLGHGQVGHTSPGYVENDSQNKSCSCSH